MSTVDGLHTPVIPFADVASSAGVEAPAQMVCDVPKLKVGVMLGATVTVNVVVVAHCPVEGVKI